MFGRLVAAAVALLLLPALAQAQEKRRFVLSAGANDGGRDRLALRYAVSDAEKFADVMRRMGGVEAGDVVLLADRAVPDGLQRSQLPQRALLGSPK